MRYTLLGHSGLRISELALGTMTFGTDWGFGGNADESRAQMKLFAEAGGNFVDTASNYTDGTAEGLVGEVVSDDRDYWVVGTKYSLSSRADDPNAAGNSRKNLIRSLETSLRRLRTDHVDVLWVHAWDDLTPVDEVLRALDDQVRAGKVRYIGISDVPCWVGAYGQAMAAARGWSPLVGLEVPYSLAAREVEREFLPMARALGMGVCAWGPLSGGLLSGKYAAGAADDGPRRLRAESPDRLRIAQGVADMAAARDTSSANLALAWLRHQGVVPIVGARTAAQLAANLGAVDLSLSAADLDRLDALAPIDLGFSRGFLDSMTSVVHGPGMRERIDLPAGGPRT
jgi:aryl-alcohol dehydrogenase-like predicted oxidoreductase